jgi:hypothetical protein
MHGIFPELILFHIRLGLLESRDSCERAEDGMSAYIRLTIYHHLHVVEAGLNFYLLDHIPLTAVVGKGQVDVPMLPL